MLLLLLVNRFFQVSFFAMVDLMFAFLSDSLTEHLSVSLSACEESLWQIGVLVLQSEDLLPS